MPRPTLRDMLPCWHAVYEHRELPLVGQVVLVCGRTYRNPPYGTHYSLARYVGGESYRENAWPNAWRGMDGLPLRESVQYWRELSLNELPFEL